MAELAIDTGKASVTTKYKVKLKDESRRESVVQQYASCEIFDKKNWDCSESKSHSGFSTRNEFRMSEGIVIMSYARTDYKGANILTVVFSGGCLIPKRWYEFN